jgi:hypothetical protein
MRRKELFPGTVQEFIKMNGGGAGIEPCTRFTFQLILAMFKDKTTGKIFILRMVVDNDMIVLGGGTFLPPYFVFRQSVTTRFRHG